MPGQDLTRVTIPAFFLEARSLLERMADTQMHPDLLLNVSTMPDPVDRIKAITKWCALAASVATGCTVADVTPRHRCGRPTNQPAHAPSCVDRPTSRIHAGFCRVGTTAPLA